MVRIEIPSSKSQVHRLLIAAALSEDVTEIEYRGESQDILATKACIEAMREGRTDYYCHESGSTLRFMIAACGAKGVNADFHMEGRLPGRPLAPYDEELRRHGMSIEKEGSILHVSGQLEPGEYSLPGNISSQYFTGLLLALPSLEGDSIITVEGELESSAYIDMTIEVLRMAGVSVSFRDGRFIIPGGQKYVLPKRVKAEGDFSNAAFFLCLGALTEEGVCVTGLNKESRQGDRAVIDVLRRFGAEVEEIDDGYIVRKRCLKGIEIDASQIPDLIPVLSITAACAHGRTVVYNAARLRLKESDRITSTVNMLRAIGASSEELPDGIIIGGDAVLGGGTVDSCGDHRIAMSAGIASAISESEIGITDPGCVKKSYPDFWEDLNEYISWKKN